MRTIEVLDRDHGFWQVADVILRRGGVICARIRATGDDVNLNLSDEADGFCPGDGRQRVWRRCARGAA